MIKSKLIMVVASAFLSYPALVSGQSDPLPRIVLSGIEAYRSTGAQAAVRTWLETSPAGRDPKVIRTTADALEVIDEAYGKVVGHEHLRATRIGSRVFRHYVILYYERGPLYLHFDVYRASDWVVTGFLFNTKPEEILPRTMLGG